MKSEARVTLIVLTIIICAFLLTLSGCSLRPISRSKNIEYQKADHSTAAQHLNIFAPKKHKQASDVLIFVHGGNWNSGKKSQYNIIGNHWAKKGIVYVVINYPLGSGADYSDMAKATANSVKWVKENISQYGGNQERIFLSGHSAGGHLAALVSIDDQYFKDLKIENPLAGTILIDAAGLDMFGYLTEEKFEKGHTYLNTFSNDPKIWKAATPLYHLHESMLPMLIYRGGKTYSSILKSNEKFIKALREYAPQTAYRIQKNKKHVPMITQFFNPWSSRYADIIDFMKGIKSGQNSPRDSHTEVIGN